MVSKNIVFALIVSCAPLLAIGQEEEDYYYPDTAGYGYKEWTDYMISGRLGFGSQNAFYSEFGISRWKYRWEERGYGGMSQYFSVEWTPTILPDKSKNIYGFKAGWEVNASLLAMAIESKYQTDFVEATYIITPKIGLGLYGVAYVFYGYNIPLVSNPFDVIGRNQISIVFNLNRFIITGDKGQR